MKQSAENRIIWALVASFMVGWLSFSIVTFVAGTVLILVMDNAGYGLVAGLLIGITAGLLSSLSLLRERLSSGQ